MCSTCLLKTILTLLLLVFKHSKKLWLFLTGIRIKIIFLWSRTWLWNSNPRVKSEKCHYTIIWRYTYTSTKLGRATERNGRTFGQCETPHQGTETTDAHHRQLCPCRVPGFGGKPCPMEWRNRYFDLSFFKGLSLPAL